MRPGLLDGRIPGAGFNPKRGIFPNARPFAGRIHSNASRWWVTPEHQPIRHITRRPIQPLAFIIYLPAHIRRGGGASRLQQGDFANTVTGRAWLLTRVPQRERGHKHGLSLKEAALVLGDITRCEDVFI